MTLGLYRHYKGDWYLGLCIYLESTNDQPRERKVFYFSLGKRQFDGRRATEFFGFVPKESNIKTSMGYATEYVPRFERIIPHSQPEQGIVER